MRDEPCNSTAAGGGDDTAEPVQQRDPAVYVIVRSDNGSQEETDGAVRLRKYIRDTMGIEIDLQTDWVKRGEEPPVGTKEILIGATNRPESSATAASYGGCAKRTSRRAKSCCPACHRNRRR